MYLKLSDKKIKEINIQNIKKCLKYKIITLETYNEWIHMVNTWKYGNKFIFKNLINLINDRVPIYKTIDINEPNFIIVSSGQSNAGGWNSNYEDNVLIDQVDKDIFSYNVNTNQWDQANLEDNSLGSDTRCRAPGSNLFVFQFAKHLKKHYPGIRPGIINECEGGRPISMWAKFNKNEKYYDEYIRSINYTNRNGGEVFDIVEKSVKNAFQQLINYNSVKIDVIIWHQGESDYFTNSNPDYYRIALEKVINQFKKLNDNELTPFIAGTILDYYRNNYNSDPINNIIRTIKGQYYHYAELSNLKSTEDKIHFSSEATRIGGRLYFEAYQNLRKKLLNEGLE